MTCGGDKLGGLDDLFGNFDLAAFKDCMREVCDSMKKEMRSGRPRNIEFPLITITHQPLITIGTPNKNGDIFTYTCDWMQDWQKFFSLEEAYAVGSNAKIDTPKDIAPKPCNCDMTTLLREGCRCGGI